jgi:hypothetical protein
MNILTPQEGKPDRRRIVLLILLAVGVLTASWFLTSPREADTIIVTFPGGATVETEVADTPEKLLFGLAFRDALPPASGMLYIFETSDRHKVWTKGFRFPVDMIWADESRHVVHLREHVVPCEKDPCPSYAPPENARYLIETEAGFIGKEKLALGAELKFTLKL